MDSECNQYIYLAIIPLMKYGIVSRVYATQVNSSRLSVVHKTQIFLQENNVFTY